MRELPLRAERPSEITEKAQKVLAQIEAERFSTFNDPGIHGIKQRLKNFNFIQLDEAQDGQCCSGHPEERDFEHPDENPHDYNTSGLLTIHYNKNDAFSLRLHNLLRNIKVEDGTYTIAFAGLGHDRHSYQELPKFEELQSVLQTDPADIRVNYQVRIRGQGKQQSPKALAEALRGFWQTVSDAISRYEAVPVSEQLQSWYFGIRSKFGNMEPTHPDFKEFMAEVGKRQNKKPESVT